MYGKPDTKNSEIGGNSMAQRDTAECPQKGHMSVIKTLGPINLKEFMANIRDNEEKKLIVWGLVENSWNVSRTAIALKMSRKSLQLKMSKFLLRDLPTIREPQPPEIRLISNVKRRPSMSNSLRYKILERDKGTCQCCGRNYQNDGVVINVDHIKPVSRYPELAKDEDNLQVLCYDCNMAKAAKYETNWKDVQ